MRRLFGTLGLLAMSAILLPSASAGIVFVDPVDISVPQTGSGIYVDMVTGVTQTTDSSGSWDFNLWASGGTTLTLNTTAFFTTDSLAVGSPVSLLSFGDPISSANATADSSTLSMANFYGQTGYIGLRFWDESSTQYLNGWVEVSVGGTNGYPASILNWAYETTPGTTILAGDTGSSTVPEPSTWMSMLGGLGVLGAVQWRRRRS